MAVVPLPQLEKKEKMEGGAGEFAEFDKVFWADAGKVLKTWCEDADLEPPETGVPPKYIPHCPEDLRSDDVKTIVCLAK